MPKPSDTNTIPESHYDIVKGNNYAQVAMVMPNGSLANNTVAFVWDGEFVRFSTLKARQKYKNLAGDQRVALCIADPTNPWRYLVEQAACFLRLGDLELARGDSELAGDLYRRALKLSQTAHESRQASARSGATVK